MLLQRYRSTPNVRDCDGYLSLHIALSRSRCAYFETAMVLSREHEGEIDTSWSGLGEPLLTLAIRYRDPSEFVRLLIHRAPECATMKNQEGELPLMYALSAGGWPLEQLQLVVDAYPGALQEPRKNVELPVHYEARRQNSCNQVL